ncbi:FAD-binding oxidoreductase [Promicromonospora iranensis]|uniref:FAD/FMN-containing dehydrogenase n=1 Tax=Promicromonospora iranensis TaxID=1105144 RepID=A0ABU2CWI4_9MICO|nr:FAD-binding oxidoreductase [Promicromonospora iranensis]MDR7385691.1 FAD/FMN-containing dehydrogenase [Promicromonospora iranensis]
MTRDPGSRAPHDTSTPGTTAADTTASGTAPAAAWRALEQSIDGELLRPDAAGYAAASRLFNRRFDDLRPAAVVFVLSADDVAECLRFARAHGVPVAVRSGGHSYAGWSSGNGRLVIDVRRMNHVTVHSGAALVGAGAGLGDVYAALDEHGVTISGGTCPSVGVSGLTLGGGHGLLSRAYGLSCDNLVEATVVTADGTVRTCDAEEEPDLFWALRGAGNGSFGIVTELRLRTHAVHESSSADLAWPWSQAEEVLAAWQDWAPDLPDEMWSALRLQKDVNGPSVSVVAFALGGHDALAERLRELPGGRTVDTIRTEPHLDTVRRFAGDTPEPADRPCYDVRSGFFARSLSAEAVAAAITTVENAPAGIDASMATVAMGGAVNRRPPHETAFVHRHHRFLGQYEASWEPGSARPESAAAEHWLGAVYSAMWPHSSGEAYQNDFDPRLPDWRRSYYGSAVGRLEELKRRYDPDRMFDFPQAL